MLAANSVGPQPGLAQQQFIGLMKPIHLPTLVSEFGEDTPHLPTAHHTAAIEVPGINDTLPLRTGFDFGSQEEFQYLSNTNEILTGATLIVRLAPLADNNNNAARVKNPRYVDDILNAAIVKAEWIYGSTAPAQVITGDENHFSMMQETGDIDLDRKLHEQAAGLSDVERVALSAAEQEVRLELPWWWSKQSAGHWHSYALGRPLKIRFTWRSVDQLLQQDDNNRPTILNAVSTTYMTNKWIHFSTAIPTEATKGVYIKKIQAMGDHGWLQLFKDVQLQEFAVTASAIPHTATFRTDMFTRYGYNMRFVVRDELDLVSDYTRNRRFRTLSINAAQFDISNKTFFPLTSDWDLKHEINGKKFIGNHELAIYNIPLCSYPDMHTQAMGGIEFSNTSLPVMTVRFPAHNNVNLRLSVFLYCHNYVRVVLKGVTSAVETVQPI